MSAALEREYRVGEEIGRGRYGVVSRCYSAATGRCFAVKSVAKRPIQDDAVDGQCLRSEVKLMQLAAGHSNVLALFDVYEDDEFLHVVLEYCGGGDLFQRITARPVFAESEARRVMVPLMEAIAHIHANRVAHRDIKPDNILFNSYNELKLADFGSAEYFGNGRLMSGIVGTPYYVAPEVVAGMDYTEKVDVWSAGVILYIMLAGIPPFYGDSARDIFEAVLRANLRFPRSVFGSVSAETKDLLRHMLCKDVSRRFSAEQVLRNLILPEEICYRRDTKNCLFGSIGAEHPWMTSGGDSRGMAILA